MSERFESRLVAVESVQERFHRDVEALARSVDRLGEKIEASSKTPWSNIIGFISVSLVIGGLVVSSLVDQISRNERILVALDNKYQEHSLGDAHPGIKANREAIARLEQAAERQEERITREVEIASQDRWTAREARLQADTLQAQIDALKRALD